MAHNLTVTVEDELWNKMRKHPEIRWGIVMKEAASTRLQALEVLDKVAKKTKLSEKDIEAIAVKIGKQITNRQ